MKLEFDENKEYTLDELEQLRNQYWDISKKINQKITELKIKDYNFTDKYIYCEDYGYMYVTWQTYDKTSIHGNDVMFFQGLVINPNLGAYRDESWFIFDALKEWYIPIDTFTKNIDTGKLKEITREDFMKIIRDNIGKLEKEIDEWIIYSENYNKPK